MRKDSQTGKRSTFLRISARKSGLAATISAVIGLSLQPVYSKLVVTSSETIELNQVITALPEDETAIEIRNPSSKSVLLIEGLVINPDASGNAKSVVRYVGKNSGFLLWLGPRGKIEGAGQSDGILIDNGQEPDPNNPQTVTFGIMRLEGEVYSANGAAIKFREPGSGVIEIGPQAKISGYKAIEAQDNGGLNDFSWINSSGVLTGYSGTAIDFSDANNRLLLQVHDGRIVGDIVGTATANIADIVELRGGEVNNVLGVEQIIVYETGKTVSEAPVLKGNVSQGTSAAIPDLIVRGPLLIGNDSTTQQTLEVDIQQSGSGRIIISLPENADSVVPVVVTGEANFGTTPAVQILPTGKAYNDLLNGQSPAVYKVLQVDGGLSSETEENIQIYTSPLITLEEKVSPGANNVLEVKVTARPPSVIEETIEQAGGGESSEEALSSLLVRAVDMLGSSDQALVNEALPVYNVIASIPKEKVANLLQLARESRINGGLSLEVDDAARRKAMLQISHRLRSMSFGDSIESQGFWFQLLKSDAHKDDTRNSTDDRILGYNLDLSGMTLGLEAEMDQWTYGGAITIATADTQKHHSNDTGKANNYQLSLYGSWLYRDWFVDAIANISYSNHDRTRYIDGFFDTPLESSYNSQVAGFQLLSGKTLQWQEYTFEPMLGFNYTYLHSGSYKEEDVGKTGFAQSVESNSIQRVEVGAGLLLKRSWMYRCAQLEPSLQLMFWHDVKGQKLETTSRYLIGSQSFTTQGADPERNSLEGTLNLDYRKSDTFTLSVGYSRVQKSDYYSDNYYLKLKYDF
ncbi:autotransporter outer membrane beta-barrel domain-containing protein [Endozoicomonas arenosclerae]|uniref:autotransporter family protein n=1 Tax=Endozoicomonas arenosclerae TaxID=1633495 RepID=UPI0007844E5E|nr:autotransporter outer membrane beta-barrel domain-containing protein [Endozoicomonas arenosclerae]